MQVGDGLLSSYFIDVMFAKCKDCCTFPSLLYLPGSGRGQAAVDSVVGKLGSGVEGRVKLLLLDVTSQESVDQAFETVRTEHGTIYGVSNRCHFISM